MSKISFTLLIDDDDEMISCFLFTNVLYHLLSVPVSATAPAISEYLLSKISFTLLIDDNDEMISCFLFTKVLCHLLSVPVSATTSGISEYSTLCPKYPLPC